ncbi:MAG: hypothetical protein QOI64_2780 [Solirubrobacteraceae bacterium]|nr:hypothetical protein [Solirubrobacteraceae bacterium]
MSLIAGYRAPYEPPREPVAEPHIATSRPGELVGIDCFYVGRLHGTKGVVWQLTAIDTYSSFAWAELVRCDGPGPDQCQISRFAQRVARTLRHAGWQMARVITDNGNEFQSRFRAAIEALGARQTKIRAGRHRPTATSNGCTAQSSKSAGAQPSRASSTCATAACNASSTPT